MTGRRWMAPLLGLAVGLAGLAPAVPSAASALEIPRRAGFSPVDGCLGRCSDILPPGEDGTATLAEIVDNQFNGIQPAHADDQLDEYAALPDGYRGLTDDAIDRYFNDASLGVPASDVETIQTPRADVTITRDRAGIGHVKGTTRYGTEYGAGWLAGTDRLWLIDVLRHVGRGQLTGFAGGDPANRAFEQQFFSRAPYTEAELQAQVDRNARSGPQARQALADAKAYLDGLNAYVAEAIRTRTLPGEYLLTGHIDPTTYAGTIEPFTLRDTVAIAALVGSLFGNGGGGEVQAALGLLAARARYGNAAGTAAWKAFVDQDDPEAVTTQRTGAFSFGLSPASPTGVALPDGPVTPAPIVFGATGAAAARTPAAGTAATAAPGTAAGKGAGKRLVPPGASLESARHGMSNALLVSAPHAAGGHPVAVFGPQAAYFAPQLLLLQELDGPGIHARGASFAGVSFYVQLGRGRSYAWSATSSSNDLTDTFAVTLCEPDGSAPTAASTHYLFHGTCTPMDTVSRTNSWVPTLADPTPAGSYTLKVRRTKYGLVESTGTVGGRPVAFTSLRTTYQHEADSILGFQELNDPAAITGPADFQRAASKIFYAFNWFYADSAHTAYYNSGANPARPRHVDPALPIVAAATNEWLAWDPATNTPRYAGPASHPTGIDQDYYISWNNKQARGVSSPGYGVGSVHRGNLLDSLVRAEVRSGRKVTRARLTELMMQAGLTDLRAKEVLPELLAVIDTAPVADAAQAAAVQRLRAWLAAGGLRAETSPGSKAYAHADAIRVMDAWWPQLVRAEFAPGMGPELYGAFTAMMGTDESPSHRTGEAPPSSSRHRGSAFQTGWWSYVDKDLRAVLGRPVTGGFRTTYCGGGSVSACRTALLASLTKALAEPAATTYPADSFCTAGDQWCADAIAQAPLGGIRHRLISWQNRPTYQQVVQFAAPAGARTPNRAAGRPVAASSSQVLLTGPLSPSLAVDGDGTTRWGSDYSDNQWFQVDLGAGRVVSRVVLRWEAAYGKAYRVETSTDGLTWQRAATVTAGNGGVDVLTFATRPARYVRMTGVARGTQWGYSLYELEVYDR